MPENNENIKIGQAENKFEDSPQTDLAHNDDVEDILNLQEANLRKNLTE